MRDGTACIAPESFDLYEHLSDALESLYARFSAEPDVEPIEEAEEEQPTDYEDAPEGTRNFTFVVKDGEIYYCEKNKLIPQPYTGMKAARIKGLCEIRTALLEVISIQSREYDPLDLRKAQDKLNQVYDRFTAKYGAINSKGNILAFSDDDQFPLLRSIEDERKDKSGIVYCSTRKNVEEICDLLLSRGLPATCYHAGLDPEERRENQDDFLYDRKTIMVATNAFGMGIDKSNVSFVIHYNMPKNMESYYQEAGRAGRDGQPADCILLYSGQDVRMAEFLIERSHEAEDETIDEATRQQLIARDRERLRQMTFYCTTTECLRHYILRYFGENSPLSCGHCSSCDTNFEEVDATMDARKILSCVYRLDERGRAFGKTVVSAILTGSKNEKTHAVPSGYTFHL